MAMMISERFESIQGEGLLSGVPSLFLRTTGCNLRCVWCDTPYTSWEPKGEEMSIDELVAWVADRPAYRHVVLTGGEPMLLPDSVELTRRLRALGVHITMETAGTVFQPVECDLMSISPKLANSTPRERDGGRWTDRHERLRYQPRVLKQLMDSWPYQLKFVVAEETDLGEIRSMVAALGAPADRVLLMPEGVEPQVLMERSAWLVEVCKREGFRYSPRLQILLYGNRRGI
jgi:7-carboxy-7-deazaguanine synthase